MEKAIRSVHIIRFGTFEVDLQAEELRKNGLKLRLRGQPFQVLAILLERPGELVTREQLQQRLWPEGTFVDFGHSLNTAVNKIREVLGDSAENPRYVETLPRRGYRFIPSVEAMNRSIPSEKAPPAVDTLANNNGAQAVLAHTQVGGTGRRKRWPWIVAAVLVAAGGMAGWHFRPKSTPKVWRAVPLTTYPGFELDPALSPDGNQVAFSWNGEKQDNFDIYIKLIDSSAPHRLTTDLAEDVSPAWSPDGRTLAFLRWMGHGRNELRLIPALGGPERKLADTLILDLGLLRLPIAWSPDGRWIVVSHREPGDAAEGLFLVSALTGEKQRLTRSAQGFYGDRMPAFSSDGRTLAFSRFHGFSVSEVYLLPLSTNFEPTGAPRRLTNDQSAANPVWPHDGRHILYVSGDGIRPSELRMMNLSGSGGPQPVPLRRDDIIPQLSLSHHLVYSRHSSDTNIYRAEVPSKGQPASQLHGLPLISSTFDDSGPRFSPDGKKIAFGSNRSGPGEIWIADADGSNPMKLTSFGGPLVGVLNWSPDSQRLVFHARPGGQADLFTIPASGGEPKRLTADRADDASPSYSHDGRWIYFTSMRSGQAEVWKMPAGGGEATRLTWGGGLRPLECPDGKNIYYSRWNAGEGIWKVPAQGGEEVRVTGPLSGWPSFDVTADGIFYAAAPNSRDQGLILFFDFSTGRSRPVVVTDRPIGGGLSISPDHRFVAFAQIDQTGSDLMLIENFVVP
jgi:Tol biopolymer transport system component/DNA-binding winged helix-turn-helix (wHTH) protein